MKNTKSKENTTKGKDIRKVPPADLSYWKLNLPLFGPELLKKLSDIDPVETPIDTDIKVKGLKNPQCLVIIGFATKLLLQSVLKTKKQIAKILIVEPNLGVFKSTLMREYMGDIVKDNRVEFLLGIPAEEMVPHLYELFTRAGKDGTNWLPVCQSPEIIVDPFLYPKHKDADKLSQSVLDGAKQAFLAMGCAADSMYRWERLIQNLDNIDNSWKILPFFKKFENVPVVVVGGGPSVKEFLNAYHKYNLKDKCLIIACDAVLRLLLENKIRPHIVTRCERKFTHILRGVEKKDTKGIYFAAYPWVYPGYFDLFDDCLMVFRDNGVCTWSGYKPGSVNGGVSAANAALEIAFLFGARKIVLTGVDLCFIDDKSHIDGTEVEFDINKSKELGKWTKIINNKGEEVTTIPVWFRCLNEYRAALRKHKGHTVYNTSLNGAKITGTQATEWKDLKIFDKCLNLDKRLSKRLEKHGSNYRVSFDEKREETSKFFKEALKELDKLFLNLEDAFLVSGREEEKIIAQLKGSIDKRDFFQQSEVAKRSLVKVWAESCRQVDQFKNKYFSKTEFGHIMLDICQVDYFGTENKITGIKNTIDIEHERLKVYTVLNVSFFRELEYYMKKIVDLFDNGADQSVDIEGTYNEQKTNGHRRANQQVLG